MYTPGPKYIKYTGRPNECRGKGIYITLGRNGIIHLSAKALELPEGDDMAANPRFVPAYR